MEQCAAGLAHLHEKRWVHCDVKPDNFLMNDEGVIKLIDFSMPGGPPAAPGAAVRRAREAAGTRSYMSPSRSGQAPRCESDVYSFGCTIYELLANKTTVYRCQYPDDLLNKHLREPFPTYSFTTAT